jgi:hypothetical protein
MSEDTPLSGRKLPPLPPPPLVLSSNLSLTRERLVRPPPSHRSIDHPPHQRGVSHFLIRYLERKEVLEERELGKRAAGEERRGESSISPQFRRAYLKQRHSPKKPLQTRFLIANHHSIAFV